MSSKNQADSATTPPGQSQGTRILLVEDDPISALALRRMIESTMNAQIESVATAEDAIRRFDSSAHDLVLMDIFLKGDLDGIEAAAQIHKNSHVPIIYVTASSDPATHDRAWETNPFAFLRKPYDQSAVVETIEQAVRAANSRRKQEMLEPGYMLDLIYDTAAIGMCVTDEEGKFVRVNKAYCDAYGYSAQELIGTHFSRVLPESIRERASSLHTEFVSGRTEESAGEWQVQSRQGQIRDVYVTAGRLVTTGGARFKVTTVTDITEKKQYVAALEQALEEREALVREAYHRVKNNLNLVNSLLYLQAQQYKQGSQLSRTLNDSINRIKALAAIHDRLYRSTDFNSIDMKHYMEALVDSLSQTLHTGEGLRVDTDIHEIQLDLDRAIACGLILNELVSNAFHHGIGENGGSLFVEFAREVGQIVLRVKDSGDGFPENFDPHATETLGMQLIHNMLLQLEASIHTAHEDGASVSVAFPADGHGAE